MPNIPTTTNNPGDLRYIGQQGATQSPSGFASFSNSQQGFAALLNDIQTKMNNHPDWTLADFSNVYAPPSQNDSASYTAKLANQLGVSPDTSIGSLKNKIGEFANAIASNEGYQGSVPSATSPDTSVTPTPSQQRFLAPGVPALQINQQQGSTPAQQKPGILQSIVQGVAQPFIQVGRLPAGLIDEALGGITGNQQLQKGGQMLASNQPLNAGYFGTVNAPGYDAQGKPLGFAGSLGQAVGAGLQVAPYAVAPEELLGGGVISSALKGAGLGYLSGAGQQLSQGQTAGQAFTPNAANIGGAVGGGALAGVATGIGSLARELSGLSPEIQNALREGTITPEEKAAYEAAAKARAGVGGLRAPSPLTLAADQVDNAANQIDSQVRELGAKVGQTKSALAGTSIGDLKPILSNFKNEVLDRYGLELTYDNQGNPIMQAVAGRTSPLNSADENSIATVWKSLNDAQGQSARNATDVLAKIDNEIHYPKTIGRTFSPIDALLYSAKDALDNQIRSVAPDLASANDAVSPMYNLQRQINQMAGDTQQKGELLLKRIFSGDKSGDVQNLFEQIRQATGIDLVKHAALARYATEAFGNPIDKSLLQQMASGAQDLQSGGILPLLFKGAKGIAQRTFASPQNVASSLIANAGPGILSKLGVLGGIGVGSNVFPPNQQVLQ